MLENGWALGRGAASAKVLGSDAWTKEARVAGEGAVRGKRPEMSFGEVMFGAGETP